MKWQANEDELVHKEEGGVPNVFALCFEVLLFQSYLRTQKPLGSVIRRSVIRYSVTARGAIIYPVTDHRIIWCAFTASYLTRLFVVDKSVICKPVIRRSSVLVFFAFGNGNVICVSPPK